ncbi:MAG: adhesin [Firmicutes bacterium]|nr:adhesin [Bacillota bacterium]
MKRIIAIVMTLMLAATSLLMSGCGEDMAEVRDDSSGSTAKSVVWDYVSPSDLKGDTAKTDASADNQTQDNQTQDGQPPSGEAPSGQPPEKPEGDNDSGEAPSGQPPEMPGGDNNNGQPPSGGAPGQGGPDTQSFDFSGDYSGKLTADGKEVTSDGEKIESTTADENALLAENGGVLKVTGADITKSGDDSNGDSCNFYGVNSSVLATGENSEVYLSDSKISSTGEGNNGVFATDSGTAYLNKVEITTTEGSNSRGLDATYGGVIYGNDLTISTAKDHCAALATDRGGGYISVTNSSLETAGNGSPLIYSTGDIEVDNVTGTSSGSQIAGIEGKNRIVINNSTLESTNDNTSGSDPIKNGVILYQSTSGDADTASAETCEFEAVDSILKTSISDGAMFYVTNNSADIVLQNTELDFDSENVQLLNASGNSSNNWGSAGKNGGTVELTAIKQILKGNVYTDEISSAEVYLTNGSEWTGVSEGENNLTVVVDSKSTWVLTEDTTIADLNYSDDAKIVDADGKTVTVIADGKTVVEGESDITLTVTGAVNSEVVIEENSGDSTGTDVQGGTLPVLDNKVLDRTAFDEYYKTSTQFGTNK